MYGFFLRGGDNHTYDRWASEIAQTFLLGWERIPFFHGPLYPYFVSLLYLRFGHDHDPVAWTQRVLGAITVVLIFYLARRVFGKKAGWVAGLLAAFCPLCLFYEGELLVETLSLFLHMSAICLLVEAATRKTLRWWLASGILIGLCCICRPNALLLVPAIALLGYYATLGTRRVRVSHSLVFLIAVAAFVTPITFLNLFVGGRFFLVTYSGSYNMYIGNAPDSLGVFHTPPSMKAIREKEQKEDIDINWIYYLWQEIRKDPLLLPKKLALKTRLFWQSGELPCDVNFYLRIPFSPFYNIPFRWAFITPLGLIGLLYTLRKEFPKHLDDPRLLLAGYLFVYMVSVILVFVPGRLRMPALAILIIFASHAVITLLEGLGLWIRKRDPKARTAFLAILLGWLCVAFCLRSTDDYLLIRWGDYVNLGSAYEIKGDYEAALHAYEQALERAPNKETLKTICENMRERIERMKLMNQ